ncbi:DUF4174 domain-containing protein [Rhodobacterales bacterium HKCCA1065]|nr:DUF4174 domain-containing protein [Rhodobacterales bacterium HKCCA1065]
MKRVLSFVITVWMALAPNGAWADEGGELPILWAEDVRLDDYLWTARPLIVFADTEADPRFAEQMARLAARPAPLLERDVVVIIDTDPDGQSDIRSTLRPRGFAVVILQKDGRVGLRRPSPRDVRELTRAIDNFALRQDELRNR